MNVAEPIVREAVLAAVSHPGFKFKWVESTTRESMTKLFVSAANRTAKKASGLQSDEQETTVVRADDYGHTEITVASPVNNSI
jgi:hypothetical protein